MTLKVLIVDDAPDVAEVLAFATRMCWPGAVIALAEDGTEALRAFAEMQPEIVILDVEIPAPNGFEVCKRIRATSQVPILMLTVRSAVVDKIRALDLGADDYLTKPFDHLELLARLRALLRRMKGPTEATQPALVVGDVVLDAITHSVQVRDTVVHLTSTEYRLLNELMRHAGLVLSHQILLERVWGPAYGGDTGYLKVFVGRLRRKLGDDPERPHYIQTEWGIGYRFIPWA